tara:strand:- start:3272 stop:3886 length:615 start_codon:yes stop_codon:yes gene_type:complete
MANFHKNAKEFIDALTFNADEIVVEIGSERGEGSTEWFNNYVKNKDIEFYSVDVVDYASTTLSHLTNTKFVVTTSGAEWAHSTLPLLNKKIKVLYLDNYDWLGPIKSLRRDEQQIVDEYKQRNVNASNLDCQREHLMQMIGCLPYMSDESIIICDDTPYQEHSGIYIGKNGAVIPYLLNYGYKIIFGPGHNRTCLEDNGLILKR